MTFFFILILFTLSSPPPPLNYYDIFKFVKYEDKKNGTEQNNSFLLMHEN